MTTPVATEETPVSSTAVDGVELIKRKMCFYVNRARQANAPQPTDEDVELETWPAFNVYTR